MVVVTLKPRSARKRSVPVSWLICAKRTTQPKREKTDGRNDGQTTRQKDSQTNMHVDRQTHGQTDRQTTEGQKKEIQARTDGQKATEQNEHEEQNSVQAFRWYR